MTKLKNRINFDSTDWNSIRETYEIMREAPCIQDGKTSDGETIIFDCNEKDHTLITEVLQTNGWIRKNVYWIDDYTVETLYKRE